MYRITYIHTYIHDLPKVAIPFLDHREEGLGRQMTILLKGWLRDLNSEMNASQGFGYI